MLLEILIFVAFFSFRNIFMVESQIIDRILQNVYNEFDDEVFPSSRSRSRRSVDNLIPGDYNLNDLPPHEIPKRVGYSAVIMGIEDIQEIGEEISLEMNLRLMWKDERLAHIVDSIQNSSKDKYILLRPSLIHKIWTPDIFIDHLKKLEQPGILQRPMSLRMYTDCTLRFSARITIVVSCPMHFANYPADTQRCNIDLKSYGYTEDKLILYWSELYGANFAYPLELQNFFVALDNPNIFKTETLSGRTYSGLRFTLILTRKLSYHMLQTFLPSIILVVVSWLSFLISLEAVPARTAVLMTCLLTLISMFASVRQSTPNVSYVKAMDIWMVVCVFFVFLTLLEFTVALKIKVLKLKQKPSNPLKSNGRFLVENEENEMEILNSNNSRSRLGSGSTFRKPSNAASAISSQHKPLTRNEEIIERLELVSSIGIPLLFICFNFFYWPWLILIHGNSMYKDQDFNVN